LQRVFQACFAATTNRPFLQICINLPSKNRPFRSLRFHTLIAGTDGGFQQFSTTYLMTFYVFKRKAFGHLVRREGIIVHLKIKPMANRKEDGNKGGQSSGGNRGGIKTENEKGRLG
jgi:hypothetical protein